MNNMLSIIGAFFVDKCFREELLEDPAGTIHQYGFHLTRFEFEQVVNTVSRAREYIAKVGKDDYEAMIQKASVPICPHYPCMYALAESDGYPQEKKAAGK